MRNDAAGDKSKVISAGGKEKHTAASEATEFQSFGHEIAGLVVNNGAVAQRIQLGDTVVLESLTFISFLGIDMDHGEITFDANAFHFKKLQLRASFAATALWFPRALELLKAKTIDPKDFLTHTFRLEEIETYFKKQRDDSSDVIKMAMVKE